MLSHDLYVNQTLPKIKRLLVLLFFSIRVVFQGLDSMGKSLDGSGTIRKQLIQIESALHPSSFYRSETVPPKRSPRFLRKPKPLLSKSQTIDVSGLKAERELEIFLRTRKEVSSSDDEDISRSRSPRRTSTETRYITRKWTWVHLLLTQPNPS